LILGIASILAVVAITILVATGIIKEKYYPCCIGAMALGLVYSTTMLGIYVVGSDIQGEILVSRNTLKYGWDFINSTGINTNAGISASSVVTGVFAPFLSKLFYLDIVWIYKAILPLFLVGVPVVLYYAFKKQIGDKRAFFATLFFMIVPVYNLEIAQIAKSMVAELFFALMILAMVSTWRWQHKGLVIFSCVVLALASHYSVGIMMLLYLFGILAVRLITGRIKWKLFAIRRIPVVMLLVIILIGAGTFFAYYQYAFGGVVNQVLVTVAKYYTGQGITYSEQTFRTAETLPEPQLEVEPSETTEIEATEKDESYFSKQENLVKVAIGLDFFSQPLEGQIFRIIQYLTQILIVVGAGYLLFRYQKYKFSAEFIAGIGCSFALLFLCVFVPNFSNIINITRFYQITLFFLAPCFVLGCDTIGEVSSKLVRRKEKTHE
jgi:uncharacterized membrane protein